tara:strand:- start:7630 stop:8385 length:756 start_codon:yes stop_codon:yes gene_type:complete
MSFNIKYDNKSDTINNWNDRKEKMVELLKHYEPSIIGMQEVLINQLEYLDTALPTYKYVGVGRDDGKEKGEFSPILYDTKSYKLLKSETFWLSDTPDKISKGWDASLERICTYGLFEDLQTKKKIYVFNTHFDHRGVKARAESVKLILKKIKEINTKNSALVLMGDLNLTPDQEPIKMLKKYLDEGQEITKKPFYGPVGSFNGFDDRTLTNKIDYLFVKNLKVETYRHIDDRMDNNKHISDHLPVFARVSW